MLLNIVENPHEETQSVKCIFDWVGKAGMFQDLRKCEPAKTLEKSLEEYNQDLKKFGEVAVRVIENRQKAFENLAEAGKKIENLVKDINYFGRKMGRGGITQINLRK